MKRLILLLMLLGTCSSCTALPAEERAFAVVLCVGRTAEEWQTHARIPTYQTGGGYLTVTGKGDTLDAALADMDAAAPMHVNLSQLRMVVVEKNTADAGELFSVLSLLSDRSDMRQQCAVAITEEKSKKLMDALNPSSGARLSKAIDLLLETRIEQGAILPAALADVIRMGERQGAVLIGLSVEEKEIRLSGGFPVTAAMGLAPKLSPEETALLSLMMAEAKEMRLFLPGASAEAREASAHIVLSEGMELADVTLSLRTTASSVSRKGLEQLLAEECLALLTRLSNQGCDVLGLGRQAIRRTHDMAEWHALGWPDVYRRMQWRVSVSVAGPA